MGLSESTPAAKPAVAQLPWPEFYNPKASSADQSAMATDDAPDSVATRNRGFTLAASYAACIARHSAQHPRMAAMSNGAIAIRNHVTAGDWKATREAVSEVFQIDRKVSGKTNTWVQSRHSLLISS